MNHKGAIRVACLSALPLLICTAYYCYIHFATPPALVIEGIKTTCDHPISGHWVAEVLGLSVDHHLSFSSFDGKEAQRRLLDTHVVAEAKVHCVKPNLLAVDLKLRQPIAVLGDYSRTGIDEMGFLFPLEPHYIDVMLPTIYLGSSCPANPWGQQIPRESLRIIQTYPNIVMVDYSRAEHPSLGSRSLVLETKRGDLIRTLPENIDSALECYAKIVKSRADAPQLIDLRLSPMAFVRPRDESIYSNSLDLR